MLVSSLRDTSGAINPSLIGSLYKTPTTDLFVEATAAFDFRLISTMKTYIVPPGRISDEEYIVKDPRMTVPVGAFTVVDSDNLLQMTFEFKVTCVAVGIPFVGGFVIPGTADYAG